MLVGFPWLLNVAVVTAPATFVAVVCVPLTYAIRYCRTWYRIIPETKFHSPIHVSLTRPLAS